MAFALAGRWFIDFAEGILTAEGALGDGLTFHVLGYFLFRDGSAGREFVFESELFFGAVDLAEVIDAGVLLSGGAGLDEVGDRDRSEEADDGHHDHNFNQREAAFAGGIDLHITISFMQRS